MSCSPGCVDAILDPTVHEFAGCVCDGAALPVAERREHKLSLWCRGPHTSPGNRPRVHYCGPVRHLNSSALGHAPKAAGAHSVAQPPNRGSHQRPCFIVPQPLSNVYSISRCAFLNAPAGPFLRHRPVELGSRDHPAMSLERTRNADRYC